MSNQFGVVVGIDNINNNKVYRVLVATAEQTEDKGVYRWEFKCIMMDKNQILDTFRNKTNWLNIKLENNEIKGSSGSLTRFEDNEHKPYVIISQITDGHDKTLGYKVADYNGNVTNIVLKEMLAYGNRMTKANKIPVQNAIFVPADGDKREHYKSYPNCRFIIEVLKVNKNKYAENKRVAIKQNEKKLSRLEEIYTKEQIIELKTGKANGVDIRIFANPALSPKQMNILRRGLERGLNVKPLAFPEFNEMSMRYYIEDLANGMDIKKYLNPQYNIEQISELSLAVEQGLDISKMANPKNSANTMAEIRERLENNIWHDELVKKDGSWI